MKVIISKTTGLTGTLISILGNYQNVHWKQKYTKMKREVFSETPFVFLWLIRFKVQLYKKLQNGRLHICYRTDHHIMTSRSNNYWPLMVGDGLFVIEKRELNLFPKNSILYTKRSGFYQCQKLCISFILTVFLEEHFINIPWGNNLIYLLP